MNLNAAPQIRNAAHWPTLQRFAADVVARHDRRRRPLPYAEAVVLDFCVWAWDTAELPLSPAALFHTPVVDYYVGVVCSRTEVEHRVHVNSVLKAFQDEAWEDDSRTSARDANAPYTPDDIVHILSWARAQTTGNRRQNANTLIALGLGAGLTPHEIIHLRSGHLCRTGRQVDIAVQGPRERTVPVLQTFTVLLEQPGRVCDPSGFVFRPGRRQAHPNSISNFLQRSGLHGLRPIPRRMRATWVVHHLNANTPVALIISAGGFASPVGLEPFMLHAREPDLHHQHRLLRYATD